MRDLNPLDEYRQDATRTHGWNGDETCGMFELPSPIDGQTLRVVASSEDSWDHVSVSRSNRCPNWPEMEFIKRKFFKDDETVMQLHVPAADHINYHPYCLHLWRPHCLEIPRPPGWMVGVKENEPNAEVRGSLPGGQAQPER
jgi:hypothetical protein